MLKPKILPIIKLIINEIIISPFIIKSSDCIECKCWVIISLTHITTVFNINIWLLMKTKEIKWHSKYLAKDMPIKIYGSDCGKPVIVFPTQSGSYLDYENFGMIDACQQFINSNKIQLYCIQTIDSDSWCNQSITPKRRAEVNELFNNYVMNELIPFIGKGNIGLTGCSMGAYYSANFYFLSPMSGRTLSIRK